MLKAKASSLALCSVDGAVEGAAMEAAVAVGMAPMATRIVTISSRRTTREDLPSSTIEQRASLRTMRRGMARRTRKRMPSEAQSKAKC